MWQSSFQYRLLPLLAIGVGLLSFGKVFPATARETRTYRGITQDKFNTYVRTDKTSDGYAKYLGERRIIAKIRNNLF